MVPARFSTARRPLPTPAQVIVEEASDLAGDALELDGIIDGMGGIPDHVQARPGAERLGLERLGRARVGFA